MRVLNEVDGPVTIREIMDGCGFSKYRHKQTCFIDAVKKGIARGHIVMTCVPNIQTKYVGHLFSLQRK